MLIFEEGGGAFRYIRKDQLGDVTTVIVFFLLLFQVSLVRINSVDDERLLA